MNDLKELGERAATCKHWKWMIGMRVEDGCCGCLVSSFYFSQEEKRIFEKGWPDLKDPATLGCLLALVREAYKDDRAYVTSDGGIAPEDRDPDRGWHVVARIEGGAMHCCGDTEAEALVIALEQAEHCVK